MVKKNETAEKPQDERNRKIEETVSRIKHTIVVMSGKGGVGKTTVASNLAFSLSLRGYQVGLLDVDIHGPNVPKMLGIEDQQLLVTEEGILPATAPPTLKVVSMAQLLEDKDVAVIWRGPMKMGAIQQFLGDVTWGDLDFLIIDLPPGTGDEPLSIAQRIPGSHAIIVTTPQEVALLDSRRSINFANQLGMKVLGLIENMSGMECPHCKEAIDLFKEGGGKKASEDFNIPFLGGIPIEPHIVMAGDSGRPFILENPDSASSRAFDSIVGRIIEIFGADEKEPDSGKKEEGPQVDRDTSCSGCVRNTECSEAAMGKGDEE